MTPVPLAAPGTAAPAPIPIAPVIEPTTSSRAASVRPPAHGIRGVTPVHAVADLAPTHAVADMAPTHAVADLAPTNRLAEEMALLTASNAELRRGDARRALWLLDGYDRRYPSGALREEVLATRLIARCQLGADQAAHRAADAFLAHHSASLLAPRVRRSCGR
jgi:hypothetical protein